MPLFLLGSGAKRVRKGLTAVQLVVSSRKRVDCGMPPLVDPPLAAGSNSVGTQLAIAEVLEHDDDQAAGGLAETGHVEGG